MFRSSSSSIKFYPGAARFILGASLVLSSYAIVPSAWASQIHPNEIRLAQAQLTTEELPGADHLSNASTLEYGDRVNGALNVSSLRHAGRRFSIYRFEGEEGQLVRINLVGGSSRSRTPGQLQTGSLLINPVVVLLAPNGEIIAQQPEQADVANALIRMNLPMTGTYNILVTSATAGGGGAYTLTLQNPD
ncbi:hypothetical protein [Egbenema bharatensis]|uniref:hypothetical protein n=1 Tax=Egbenema bharatensis TaxID=3463334 RepID=UPI003A86E670